MKTIKNTPLETTHIIENSTPSLESKLIIQELQNIESESLDIDGLLGNSTIQ